MKDDGVDRRVRGVATMLLDCIEEHVCPRIALEEAVRTGDTSWKEKVRI